MKIVDDSLIDRDFWRLALGAGGCTRIPRWSAGPAGEAERIVEVPAGLPREDVLLAVHVRVLAALSGESVVTTGYAGPGSAEPLPLRVAAGDGSWDELIGAATLARDEALRHNGFSPARLREEYGLPYESVLDLGGAGGGPLGEQVLRTTVTGDRLVLRYRTDVVDDAFAERIGGYYLNALRQAASRTEGTLLGEEELRYQLDVLAGAERELPGRRFHELFEEQARQRPDALAAACGERRWTYAELNSRANRIAWTLIGRGLRAEDVVAVISERGLDWMAAVIGVLKAGGVYLPVEPHFPEDRVRDMLERSSCGFTLTDRPGSSITFDEAYAEAWRQDDPGIPVRADQAAYIFFTSGSTGVPKGAVCEQAGMLNHLYAKIDDLEIGPGRTVAQTAPQCFDISLWQLLAAPMVGGSTLIVEQDVILDARRFTRLLAERRVEVVQLVPSYLEAVLAFLDEEPLDLPCLRFLSVTGEAVKQELLARWFARFPGVRVLNAYGLTETHDDTNHELLDRAPSAGGVPLGAPIAGARVYVVDEAGWPVPLGSPGEIAFSGRCVARCYVGDEERTALAFTEDPHRPGTRLYRSGDHGYWRGDGKLAFLGRRDAQVKIRGHRVELGEVENRLLRVPGVRDGAVIVSGSQLLAFYTADRPIAEDELRSGLAAALPAYMVPARFHALAELPLTGNGKTDRKQLAALAPSSGVTVPPETDTERRVAALWARALGLPEDGVGRTDDFYALGGTSLSAIRFLAGLSHVVSVRELAERPVLADFAAFLDGDDQQLPGLSLDPAKPPVLHVPEGDPGWLRAHRDELAAVVARHGSVLVRGLGSLDLAGMRVAADALLDEVVFEREAFAPRDVHGGGVYSATRWPADQPLCMHHELSYTSAPPRLLLLGCVTAPASGGATALADGAAVLDGLPGELVERFESQGWVLTRYYSDEVGLSWQEAFRTQDRAEVERHCAANGITFTWRDGDALATSQHRPAVVTHPFCDRRIWFNQIAFLNAWTMAPEVRQYLVDVYGADRLPFDTRYGDGEPIGKEEVDLINKVYEASTLREPWHEGDLMIIDNVRMAHSREPYRGAREILVAMGNPVALP